MISSTVISADPASTTVSSFNEYTGSSSSSSVILTKVDTLNVVSGLGNVQGDHKTPNAFGYLKTVTRSPVGYVYNMSVVNFGRRTQTTTGSVSYGSAPQQLLNVDFAHTDDDAWGKVYDQLRGNSSLIVDLAEGHQTLRMLKNTLNLKKFIGEFATNMLRDRGFRRRSGPSQGQRRLDYVTGKWLEYRYGWTPFVHSIYDALDNIAKFELARTIDVKGKRALSQSKSAYSGTGSFSDPIQFHTDELSFRTFVKARFKLPSVLAGNLYDWTSLNPVKIGFELMPLSFVADWVMNVSQVLDSFENYWLYKRYFAGGMISRSYKQTRTAHFTGSTSNPMSWNAQLQRWNDGNYVNSGSSSSYARQVYHNRQLVVTLPLAASPRIVVNLGAKRQLDAAALLVAFTKNRTSALRL